MRNSKESLMKKEVLAETQAEGSNPTYERLSPGDVKLLSSYYEKNYKKSYNLALGITRNIHMAEDIAQESFYKAYGHFHHINGHQHFDRWLAVTTTTTAIDAIRKNKRYVFLEDYQPMASNLPADTYLPEPTVLQEEERKTMLNQVESLEPIYSDVILLKYYGDLSYEEIARLKNIKENTLRSRCHRALKLLMAKGQE